METTARLREFVTTNFYIPKHVSIDDSTSFIGGGILDSTGVLELVAYIETQWGIRVLDDEIVPANFDSLAALAAFIDRKRTP